MIDFYPTQTTHETLRQVTKDYLCGEICEKDYTNRIVTELTKPLFDEKNKAAPDYKESVKAFFTEMGEAANVPPYDGCDGEPVYFFCMDQLLEAGISQEDHREEDGTYTLFLFDDVYTRINEELEECMQLVAKAVATDNKIAAMKELRESIEAVRADLSEWSASLASGDLSDPRRFALFNVLTEILGDLEAAAAPGMEATFQSTHAIVRRVWSMLVVMNDAMRGGIPCVNGGKNKKMMQAADAALAAAGRRFADENRDALVAAFED